MTGRVERGCAYVQQHKVLGLVMGCVMHVRAIGFEAKTRLEMGQRIAAVGGWKALHHTAHRLAPLIGGGDSMGAGIVGRHWRECQLS